MAQATRHRSLYHELPVRAQKLVKELNREDGKSIGDLIPELLPLLRELPPLHVEILLASALLSRKRSLMHFVDPSPNQFSIGADSLRELILDAIGLFKRATTERDIVRTKLDVLGRQPGGYAIHSGHRSKAESAVHLRALGECGALEPLPEHPDLIVAQNAIARGARIIGLQGRCGVGLNDVSRERPAVHRTDRLSTLLGFSGQPLIGDGITEFAHVAPLEFGRGHIELRRVSWRFRLRHASPPR
jgi:hypothetical protein